MLLRKPRRQRLRSHLASSAALIVLLVAPAIAADTNPDHRGIALQMAELLRSARTVISSKQALINDASRGDKQLTGDHVLETAVQRFRERAGFDPHDTDPDSLQGALLRAQMKAIVSVMDQHQDTINAPGIGFKGFIPAIFARLVNEHVEQQVGDKARIKVTAPRALVRNRKARPDDWEHDIIETRLQQPGWPRGKPFAETVSLEGKAAYRILVPSYYAPSCLACHGGPKGDMDITGYPKEGGQEGDLGAVISVTLFQ